MMTIAPAPFRRRSHLPECVTMNSSGNDPIRNLPLVTEPRRGDRPASTWQVLLTAFGLIAIVTVFFWALNNQRDETAGEQTAATMPTPVAPQGDQQGQQQGQQQTQQPQQPPSPTGQGGGEDKSDQKDQPQTGGQANGPPADGNGQPAQRQSK